MRSFALMSRVEAREAIWDSELALRRVAVARWRGTDRGTDRAAGEGKRAGAARPDRFGAAAPRRGPTVAPE